MSLKNFKTDPQIEKEGFEVDFGDFKVTLARAGGANKRFVRLLEARTKPYKRAIQTDTMDNDVALNILKEVYAEAVILKWETKVDDKWKSGVEDINSEEFKLLPANKENILKVLVEMPDLFNMLQEEASKAANFRNYLREEDAKN